MLAGAIERDWQQIRDDANSGHDAWREGVDAMILGGPPNLQADLVLYRDTYERLIERLTAMTSEPDLRAAFEDLPLTEVQQAGVRINQATRRTC